MSVNIYMFIAWAIQVQQQSKIYASSLSNDQAFFSVLIDRVHTTSHTAAAWKQRINTLQYLILKVTAS